MIDKLIIKRFFFRKNQSGQSDWILPAMFLMVISIFSVLIFIQTLKLSSLNKDKEAFINNKWNNVYDLYLKDITDHIALNEFRKEINNKKEASFYDLDTQFPSMMFLQTINDTSKLIDQLQTYRLSEEDTHLHKLLNTNNKNTEPTIYLNEEIISQLEAQIGDYLIVKPSYGRKDMQAILKIEVIRGKTRHKAYIFDNYLTSSRNKSKRKLRYYFDNQTEIAQFFIYQLNIKDRIKPPYYVGSADKEAMPNNFLAVYKNKEELEVKFRAESEKTNQSEKRYIDPSDLNNPTLGKSILDTSFNISYNCGEVYKSKELKIEDYSIYIDTFLPIINDCERKGEVFSITSARFLKKDDDLSNLYVELDLYRNISHYLPNNKELILNSQLKLIDNIKNEKFSFWHSSTKIKKNDDRGKIKKVQSEIDILEEQFTDGEINTNSLRTKKFELNKYLGQYGAPITFMYYHDFKDDDRNEEIMSKLDGLNVRWDNARWSSIIELNKNIKSTINQIQILLFLNLIAFILVLVIKFLLRFKLELHTIGVLKCFGYSRNIIFGTYNIGNLILIILGFIIGIFPLGYIAKLNLYTDMSLVSIYSGSEMIYCWAFLMMIGFASIITTSIFLYLFTEKGKNIYELIKYES